MQDRWTHRIDSITAEFKQTFGALSEDQFNWKPNPQTWSIAQNLDHLIVINKTYEPVLAAVREGNYTLPFMGKLGFMVNFLGKMVLNSVQPDRKRKMKTFSIWQPSTSKIGGDILFKFEQHQIDLKGLILSNFDLLGKDVVISSPANKNIVYKLETAFDIIVAHEQRHFEQAKEVLVMQV